MMKADEILRLRLASLGMTLLVGMTDLDEILTTSLRSAQDDIVSRNDNLYGSEWRLESRIYKYFYFSLKNSIRKSTE